MVSLATTQLLTWLPMNEWLSTSSLPKGQVYTKMDPTLSQVQLDNLFRQENANFVNIHTSNLWHICSRYILPYSFNWHRHPKWLTESAINNGNASST